MVVLLVQLQGIYTIVAASVMDAFGPEHYQANFGLLFSRSIVYCFTVLTLTKVDLDLVSTSEYLFLSRFPLSTLLLVIMVCLL